MTLDEILDCLNENRIRATYGAVGDVLGKPARVVGNMLGPRTPRASWVVSAEDHEPYGYGDGRNQAHPDLYHTEHVITSGRELHELLAGRRVEPPVPAGAIEKRTGFFGTTKAHIGPMIQAFASIVAAVILTCGALIAAGTFEPKFLRAGEHIINLGHLVEVARQDDGEGCTIVISISESIVREAQDQFRQFFAGHQVDDEAECQELREHLAEYTVGE